MTITVRSRGYKSVYYRRRHKVIPGMFLEGLNDYCQWDSYSCGYLAALSVVHYYYPEISDKKVLSTIKPLANWGTSRSNIVDGLWELGIHAEYRDDLTIRKLKSYVKSGVAVVIAVWHDDNWVSDHWCCVRGFSKGRVHLTNNSSLELVDFERIWISNYGGGWVTGAGLVTSLVE